MTIQDAASGAESPRSEAGGFASLGLDEGLLRAVAQAGFAEPTPIQARAIPALLKGRDVIGRARTGSGKTAAFGIPMLQRIREGGKLPRALVLAPTRELALQITDALRDYARHLPVRAVTIYGGAPFGPQRDALRKGAALVVGTPGRVLDHIDRGTIDLGAVEMVALDEADEMLRMGFLESVEKILAATPEARQTALFSATMPKPIRAVADSQLKDPEEVQVESQALTTAHIAQSWMPVNGRDKSEALYRVLRSSPVEAALVFVRTRASCAEVSEALAKRGVSAEALHGDVSQAGREQVLAKLRSRHLDVVVATDVAARGIDVDHISHVINYDFPVDHETYVHRIGRTGRAGRAGRAVTFVTRPEAAKMSRLAQRLKIDVQRESVPSEQALVLYGRTRLRERILSRAALLRCDDTQDGAASKDVDKKSVMNMLDFAEELGQHAEGDDLVLAMLWLLGEEQGGDIWRSVAPEKPKKLKATEKVAPKHKMQKGKSHPSKRFAKPGKKAPGRGRKPASSSHKPRAKSARGPR